MASASRGAGGTTTRNRFGEALVLGGCSTRSACHLGDGRAVDVPCPPQAFPPMLSLRLPSGRGEARTGELRGLLSTVFDALCRGKDAGLHGPAHAGTQLERNQRYGTQQNFGATQYRHRSVRASCDLNQSAEARLNAEQEFSASPRILGNHRLRFKRRRRTLGRPAPLNATDHQLDATTTSHNANSALAGPVSSTPPRAGGTQRPEPVDRHARRLNGAAPQLWRRPWTSDRP